MSTISSIQSSSIYNLSNTVLSGYSAMNNLKLTQALGNTNYSVGAATSVKSALSWEASSFLKDYRAGMTDMMTAASNVINPKSSANRLGATSSNTSIAKTSGNLKAAGDSYEINVQALASEQINRSQAMQSSGALPALSGRLNIQTDAGAKDIYFSAQSAKTNKEALEQLAAKINEANAGVTAKVVQKDANVTLELSGTAGKSFTASGSLADRLGLDQVAQEKQDAVYSVSKNGGAAVSYTSAGNEITIDGSLSATLQGVGTAGIAAGTNGAETLADAMEKMLGSFNKTLTLLNNNANQGMGVLQQMKRMIMPPTSEKSMQSIGISVKADGTMSLDRAKFIDAMQKDDAKTSGIAKDVARGIQNDATQGLRIPSSSLVGQSNQQLATSSYDMSSIKMLSAYSRSGSYNLLNYYAVGAMMNFMA